MEYSLATPFNVIYTSSFNLLFSTGILNRTMLVTLQTDYDLLKMYVVRVTNIYSVDLPTSKT